MKTHTIEALLGKAQDMIDQYQPELAVKFLEKALAQSPEHVEVLDALGELYMELTQEEKAKEVFGKSIQLEPKGNPGKWLYMAQLFCGEDAIWYYEQGITLLQAELESRQMSDDVEHCMIIRKQICEAYCSLTELYMTDLCDEPNAEALCEQFLEEAMKYDIGMPEPTQALANLKLVQEKSDEASEYIKQTYDRLCECDENNMPSMEFRIVTGKLLMAIQKNEEAIDVLEGVLQEDDENAEMFYLVGKAYAQLEEPDISTALEFLHKCQEMLELLKKKHSASFQLEEQLNEVNQFIVQLQQIAP